MIQIRAKNKFWHELRTRRASAPICAVGTEFQKISDSGEKINFGMSSGREAPLHRFEPWGRNFKKIQIRPEKYILAWPQEEKGLCTDLRRGDRISKNFRLGQKNTFWHGLRTRSASAPICALGTEFQLRFERKNKFLFISSGQEAPVHRFAPWERI